MIEKELIKKRKLEIAECKNVNFEVNSKRVLREVLDNMEVSYSFTKRELEIVKDAVQTTLWELFQRKEERLKEDLNKVDSKWEFKI